MKKSKITIKSNEDETTVDLTFKEKKDSRIFKLIAGNNYYREGETLVKVKIVGDNKHVIVTDNNGKKQKMEIGTFFDLCTMFKHLDQVPGINLIGKTEVVKKKKTN